MIYISSSCVRSRSIRDAVIQLAEHGFKNIELTGGTDYYERLEEDLLELKSKHNLRYLCHNYFPPPPKKHFVLNLASLDDEIYEKSIEHIRRSMDLSLKLGGDKFGFHAGFLVDIHVNEIGRKVTSKYSYDRAEALERFCSAVKLLQNESGKLKLYIENNVLSFANHHTFKGSNPFMLLNYEDYQELCRHIAFNFLLDIAHLKVSCHSMGLVLQKELDLLWHKTDYLHISSNNGLEDQNKGIEGESEILFLLEKYRVNSNWTVTLEIYEGLDEIEESFHLVERLMGGSHTDG